MNTVKIVLKTLSATFAVLAAFYAIGKVEMERRELETKVDNLRRRNRVLLRTLNHAGEHLTQEDFRHVRQYNIQDYKFEQIIRDFDNNKK